MSSKILGRSYCGLGITFYLAQIYCIFRWGWNGDLSAIIIGSVFIVIGCVFLFLYPRYEREGEINGKEEEEN